MLGGVRRDGSSGVNELTWLVLRTALETRMIDPKINLRIDYARSDDQDAWYLAVGEAF